MAIETPTRTLTILDPAVTAEVRPGKLAARPADRGAQPSLSGLRIGLLDNVKTNADAFLGRVEERLRERYQVTEFVRRTKPQAGQPCPADAFEALAHCDVVINAFGD